MSDEHFYVSFRYTKQDVNELLNEAELLDLSSSPLIQELIAMVKEDAE